MLADCNFKGPSLPAGPLKRERPGNLIWVYQLPAQGAEGIIYLSLGAELKLPGDRGDSLAISCRWPPDVRRSTDLLQPHSSQCSQHASLSSVLQRRGELGSRRLSSDRWEICFLLSQLRISDSGVCVESITTRLRSQFLGNFTLLLLRTYRIPLIPTEAGRCGLVM